MLQLISNGKASEISTLKRMTVRDFYAFYEAHLVYMKQKSSSSEDI